MRSRLTPEDLYLCMAPLVWYSAADLASAAALCGHDGVDATTAKRVAKRAASLGFLGSRRVLRFHKSAEDASNNNKGFDLVMAVREWHRKDDDSVVLVRGVPVVVKT